MGTSFVENSKCRYEVLAPAGSYTCMVAAFNAGADAVYLGGNLFGARASADNFTEEQIIQAIEYAHLRGKKIFLTVNTLLKNTQLNTQLYDYIKPLYEAGLDAVIVQDFGVMEFIKEYFPGMDIHASTQMTVTGLEFAKKLKQCGVTRIVPARELSYSEIKSIYDATQLEIECFVHGALCYCYSGMCLLSSIIGGRSGNRGRCAQPCRLPYDVYFKEKNLDKPSNKTGNNGNSVIYGEYPLSPADLCTLDIIPDILESGVYSLKIEGRMKKPEYVASVTAMYRKYVDMYIKYGRRGYKVDEDDIRILKDIYNRGEFTDGYYKRHNGADIMSVKRPNHTGTRAAQVLSYNKKRQEVTAKALEKLYANDVLELFTSGNTANSETLSMKGVSADIGEIFTTKVSAEAGKYLEKKQAGNSEKKSHLNEKMHIMRTRNNMLISEIEKKYISEAAEMAEKIQIGGAVTVCRNAPVVVDVWCDDVYAHIEGSVPQEAENRPVLAEDISRQIRKTGATEFVFDDTDLTISVEEGLFINIKELNQLRRDAIAELKAKLLKKVRYSDRKAVEISRTEFCATGSRKKTICSAYISTREQFDAAVCCENVDIIAFESSINNWDELIGIAHDNHKEVFMSLPYIFREHGKKHMEKHMDFLKDNRLDGYVFRNMEEISWFESCGLDRKKTVVDNTIYGFNDKALSFIRQYNPYLITASFELNMKELNHLAGNELEICVYGNIPVMITAGCIKKTYDRCDGEEGITIIKDRLGNKFKCRNQCNYCYNIIYNSKPLKLTDIADELNQGFISKKYLFTTESGSETKMILSGKLEMDFTRGHFKRGVD